MRSFLALLLLAVVVAWLMTVAWSNEAFELYGRVAVTVMVGALILGAFFFSFARGYRRG